MREEFRLDPVLLACILLLMGLGLVMVYSTSSIYALKKYKDAFYFLKRQAIYMTIGLILFFIVSKLELKIWRVFAYPLLILSLCMLTLVFTKYGYTVGGATRWLKIGMLNIQPVELAKFSLIVYLAYSLSKKVEKIKTFSIGVLPHLIVTGIFFVLIIMEPDFGNAIILVCISLGMMIIGGVRFSHIMLIGIFGVPLLIYEIFHASYRFRRFMTFLNPWADPTGSGFQIIQSTLAFASGGVFGTGLGNGRQKLFYLPASHTDFIFSNIGEELGLIGVLFTILLYNVIVWRGFFALRGTQDGFILLLVSGMLLLIIIEALVNMCVGLGALPTKGLTLPLISYGGSSVIVTCVALGIIMSFTSRRFSR